VPAPGRLTADLLVTVAQQSDPIDGVPVKFQGLDHPPGPLVQRAFFAQHGGDEFGVVRVERQQLRLLTDGIETAIVAEEGVRAEKNVGVALHVPLVKTATVQHQRSVRRNHHVAVV